MQFTTDRLQPNSPPSLLAAVEWLVLLLLAWYVATWLASPDVQLNQADFVHFFYVAGERFTQRLSPYDFVSQWGDSFNNPPWFALLMMPFALFSVEVAAYNWLGLNLVLLAVTVLLAKWLTGFRLGLRRTLLLFLALLLWEPVQAQMVLGQNSLLVAAAAYGATVATSKGHTWLAGCLLVIAASKPQLIFLLGPGLTLWAWRRHGSLGVPVGFCSSVVVALSICLAITPSWVNDLLQLRPTPVGAHVDVQTLLFTAFEPAAMLRLFYYGVVLVPSSLALLLYWLHSHRPLVELAGLTLAATLLITPYAQLHDYVVLVLPLLLVAIQLYRRPATRRTLLLATPVAYMIVAIDGWIHGWIEHKWVWLRLQELIGEQRVVYLWEQSQWNWRFIALLLPLGVTIFLSRRE